MIRASGKKGIANTLPAVFRYRSSAITISSSGSVELKLKAISLEMEWYRSNMKSLYIKPIDDLFALKLDEMFNRVFFKKRMRLISGDINDLNKLADKIIKEADCHPLDATKYRRTLALAMG